MELPTPCPSDARRLAIATRGVVQGVGFRPFVYNAARSEGLTGWVTNEADMVRIEVQGGQEALDAFLQKLKNEHPPQARIDSVDVTEQACDENLSAGFEIRFSQAVSAPRPTIPADLATCADCLDEIRDPAQRRFAYPFTNCTNCGPRWSIIRRVPYDRLQTSMARFTMCPDCRAEYEEPTDRRFHAQPIACPKCGPQLRLLDSAGNLLAVENEALDAAARALMAGQIVAMKGLGGFQLLVDATDEQAVTRLRERKHRPDRPFALMIGCLAEVRRRCELSVEEAQALGSHQAPILLLHIRRDPDAVADVAANVAPDNPHLGVMLPYTPLHHLLMAAVDRPIVCTSGNLSEEPMVTTTKDALRQLGPIADLVLTHNRPIVRAVDDSVARVDADGLQVLRRARGYAPLPIELPITSPTIMALGGHLKNAVALTLASTADQTNRASVIISPHIGDLDTVLSVETHRRAVRDLIGFFDAKPEVVACDLHPDYASSCEAEALAARWDVPLVRVQHHHAHVAACMAEHRLEGPVLGFAWDGTGFGTDGTVWGGETLICEDGQFTRVAHLRTFALPGGDQAVRQPRRSALGLLFEVSADLAAQYAARWFTTPELHTLTNILQRGLQAPRTSSMGRLFDAIAALCGFSPVISFEGQAAMALEFAADETENGSYPIRLIESDLVASDPAVIDWEPMLRAALADRDAGEPAGRISARFHNALAEMAVKVARLCGCGQIVLSGGCFQNRLLSDRIRTRLAASGFNVYTNRDVPPGDGGLALGQVFIAAHHTRGS